MTDPLPLLPPPILPPEIEERTARLEAIRAERAAWTGRYDRQPVSVGQALVELVEHDFAPPHRQSRSPTERLAFADHLRENLTPAEWAVWEWLRGFELDFQAQVVVGGWVVDFCSASLHLIIEVDGSAHAPAHRKAQDTERELALNARGYRVVRITNADALAGVFGRLLRAIQEGGDA